MLKQCETDKTETKMVMDSSETGSLRLHTIKQFCTIFPWPSESAMRAYIYRANELGISEAFVRVNRRVLVDSSKFFFLIKQVESRSHQGGKYETTSCPKGKVY